MFPHFFQYLPLLPSCFFLILVGTLHDSCREVACNVPTICNKHLLNWYKALMLKAFPPYPHFKEEDRNKKKLRRNKVFL